MVASLPLSAGASPGCLRTFWSHPRCLLRCMADIHGVTCRISIDEAFPFTPLQWMWARLLQNRKGWDGDGIPVSAALERWHHGLTRMYLGLAAFAEISKKKNPMWGNFPPISHLCCEDADHLTIMFLPQKSHKEDKVQGVCGHLLYVHPPQSAGGGRRSCSLP